MNNFLIENHFQTSIYKIHKPEFLKPLIKATDKYILDLKNKNKDKFGTVFHSLGIAKDKNFNELNSFIGESSYKILDQQGYDLTKYKLFISEMWVQEFTKLGGGNHSPHIHWNGHISGFYFLKCSNKTSYPIFHDPRPGKMMNMLKQKNTNLLNYSTEQVYFKPIPGDMFFFNSYLSHEFPVDDGKDAFRFIHFNVQAINKVYEI
jgi:uncharacterized protein (TIGR02466 family)